MDSLQNMLSERRKRKVEYIFNDPVIHTREHAHTCPLNFKSKRHFRYPLYSTNSGSKSEIRNYGPNENT